MNNHSKNHGWGSRLDIDRKGVVHVIGGNTNALGRQYNTFDLRTKLWHQMPQLPHQIKCHGVCVDYQDRVYCFGGFPKTTFVTWTSNSITTLSIWLFNMS